MRRLTSSELHARQVNQLGLDPDALDLTSVEATAAALRRMSSFLCPCSNSTLVRSVVQPLRGVVDDIEETKRTVKDTLAAMIAHGDIIESPTLDEDAKSGTTILLYPAPASFVARRSGTVLLTGVASDEVSALPDGLADRVEYANHVRRLCAKPDEDLRSTLSQHGLIELSYDRWINGPHQKSSAEHLSFINGLLDRAQPSYDVPGLLILDPERPVGYYRGRWTNARSHTGNFVARRTQAYGNKLWCYVMLRNGNPKRVIDFPLRSSRWRGCDEAWHLQMAIDAQRGIPQRFNVRQGPENMHVLQFYSPVPMWAQRRWDAVGEPIPASGCLFSYRLAEAEFAEELKFLRGALWLEEL